MWKGWDFLKGTQACSPTTAQGCPSAGVENICVGIGSTRSDERAEFIGRPEGSPIWWHHEFSIKKYHESFIFFLIQTLMIHNLKKRFAFWNFIN